MELVLISGSNEITELPPMWVKIEQQSKTKRLQNVYCGKIFLMGATLCKFYSDQLVELKCQKTNGNNEPTLHWSKPPVNKMMANTGERNLKDQTLFIFGSDRFYICYILHFIMFTFSYLLVVWWYLTNLKLLKSVQRLNNVCNCTA